MSCTRRASDFDPASARSAELLQTQLDRFESLLGDLLEISRHDAGAASLEADALDVRDLVRRVVDATEPLAVRRGSVVTVHMPDEPCICEADGRRVERILRNLLVNAAEHGEGSPIDVYVVADAAVVAIAVRDHGIGLRPGESSLVFNRFWRADPARARTTGGTGLGLSIASEDARLHGGRLQAWGERGKGSQFVLTLPRQAGSIVTGSPIPVEPPDATSDRTAEARCDERREACTAPPREHLGVARSTWLRCDPATRTPGHACSWSVGARCAALALAACTAVPDSGPVHAGQQPAQARRAHVRVNPRAPVTGLSPDNIVTGFRFANSDTTEALGVAKAYLLDGASWQPIGATVVADSGATLTDVTTGPSTVTVKVVDTQVGTDRGRRHLPAVAVGSSGRVPLRPHEGPEGERPMAHHERARQPRADSGADSKLVPGRATSTSCVLTSRCSYLFRSSCRSTATSWHRALLTTLLHGPPDVAEAGRDDRTAWRHGAWADAGQRRHDRRSAARCRDTSGSAAQRDRGPDHLHVVEPRPRPRRTSASCKILAGRPTAHQQPSNSHCRRPPTTRRSIPTRSTSTSTTATTVTRRATTRAG